MEGDSTLTTFRHFSPPSTTTQHRFDPPIHPAISRYAPTQPFGFSCTPHFLRTALSDRVVNAMAASKPSNIPWLASWLASPMKLANPVCWYTNVLTAAHGIICIFSALVPTSRPGSFNGWPQDRPDNCQFVLHKSSKGTMDTIRLMADRLRTKPNRFQFAGNKDARAVTSQLVTAYVSFGVVWAFLPACPAFVSQRVGTKTESESQSRTDTRSKATLAAPYMLQDLHASPPGCRAGLNRCKRATCPFGGWHKN
jgi:hypothetical protein